MLSFIPMNDTASIYSQTGELDSWGQPTLTKTITNKKCQINYNTDLTKISGNDGMTTTMSATILFNGQVLICNGDYAEFTTDMGVTKQYKIVEVLFVKDYGGKILGTRVVMGNGKRT
jgi:hypothetical protein